jgi:hypothetical protein
MQNFLLNYTNLHIMEGLVEELIIEKGDDTNLYVSGIRLGKFIKKYELYIFK